MPPAPGALEAYPGGDVVAAGLRDLAAGRGGTPAALLVCVAAPR